MKKLPFAALVLGFAVAIPVLPSVAQDAPVSMRPVPAPAVEDVFDELIGAIMDDNYTGFLLSVDENFRAALTKPVFEKVVQQIGPLLKTNFKTTYLDQLQRDGYTVHLWKIEFETGNDLLAEVSIKDGKVGGFVLR